jgi:hypothetical protein
VSRRNPSADRQDPQEIHGLALHTRLHGRSFTPFHGPVAGASRRLADAPERMPTGDPTGRPCRIQTCVWGFDRGTYRSDFTPGAPAKNCLESASHKLRPQNPSLWHRLGDLARSPRRLLSSACDYQCQPTPWRSIPLDCSLRRVGRTAVKIVVPRTVDFVAEALEPWVERKAVYPPCRQRASLHQRRDRHGGYTVVGLSRFAGRSESEAY